MNIEIDIHDYLDESEIQDAVTNALYRKATSDVDTLFVNASYAAVRGLIAEMFVDEPELPRVLRAKVRKAINEHASFNLFYKADDWQKRRGIQDSVGQQILESAVEDNKAVIQSKVAEMIGGFGYDELKQMVLGVLETAMDDANEWFKEGQRE